VTYNSDGRVQFTETWAVPSSPTPLRVRDVRTSASSSGNVTSNSTVIQEADITGLIADLGARPLKGPGFAPGRIAMVNALGALESVTGSPSDCVRVDGSSGPCGTGSPAFVDGESLGGLVDGVNATFTLSSQPDPPSSLAVYRNGLLQKMGLDYTLSGSTLQFVMDALPQPGDTLLASYRLGGGFQASGTSVPVVLDASQITTGVMDPARLPVMGASGNLHQAGIVPDPGSAAGSTRFLREDGTWVAVSGGGGGGDVSSVFGRTGAVTAQTGDYSAAQVTNAVDSTASYTNPAWIASLPWAKLTGVPSFEPAIGAGTNTQYWRGDKSWQTLNAAAVANAVDSTASYTNPAWIASLPWTKLTGVPSFEPAIGAGTGAQYWRGDKTWQTLNAAAVTNAVDSTASYTNPAWITSLTWAKLTGVPSAFVPSAHAPSHQHGGADEIATAVPAPNAIPKADATGKLAGGWLPGGSASTKTLYYAPAAKNINGVGASAFQCVSNCPTAMAINSGSAAVASLHVTAGTNNQTSQDQFIVPVGYGNQTVTLEVVFRSADAAHSATITPSIASVSTGDIANPTFIAAGSAITVTGGAGSGRTVATTTFTPAWSVGDTIFWKLAYTVTNLTSDLEILSVRFYATF
jgi:hypothetical protein